MFRLYCDLCNTEIEAGNTTPMATIKIEEAKYMGSLTNGCNKEFLIDTDCINHKAYLCPKCLKHLRDFLFVKKEY